MIDLGILLGHLVGDYIVQNDWMAKWKAVHGPGWTTPRPTSTVISSCGYSGWAAPGTAEDAVAWDAATADGKRGWNACTLHCLLYTAAMWAFSWQWLPLWGVVACFLTHWIIDRYRLAGVWMRNVSGQSYFASPEHPMFPWSIVAVDNTFHLLTMYAIRCIHLYCS